MNLTIILPTCLYPWKPKKYKKNYTTTIARQTPPNLAKLKFAGQPGSAATVEPLHSRTAAGFPSPLTGFSPRKKTVN